MEPWIIEKIQDEKRRQKEETKVQPQLPVPLPLWEIQPEQKSPGRDSSIIDFEIKI
jgi:hypothetical protein